MYKFFNPCAVFPLFALLSVLALSGCSTNPATGQSQFTALMSPAQEKSVGASEHQKIKAQYGFVEDEALKAYVRKVGQRVSANTERSDVLYQFFVLDSPIVNAFALPGGYVYVSRGLLALANSEAELAAVLSHEVGHITGRHSAERYSKSVVTSLGAAVLSAALDNGAASQALGVGSNLYLSAYSRGQERESDMLGLRYMTRGGYDANSMSLFLASLKAQSDLEARIAGQKQQSGANYFSTHPATAERVAQTRSDAKIYDQKSGARIARAEYLAAIDGLVYGDSAAQGLIRGQSFYHPVMGFAFDVPEHYRIINGASQVVARSQNGALMLFDMAPRAQGQGALSYLTQNWLKGEALDKPQAITIGGLPAATASFAGKVGNRPVTIRLVAIEWAAGRFARFQVSIPQGTPAEALAALKRATYSFRRLNAKDRAAAKPYLVRVVTAKKGDNVASLARRQPFTTLQEERFRMLNGLAPKDILVIGRRYKLVFVNES